MGLTQKATVYVHRNDVICCPVERCGSVEQQKQLYQDLDVDNSINNNIGYWMWTDDDAVVESVFRLDFFGEINVKYDLI